MKNLINFFFSFDKLFKEKLIVPFFWLAIIVWGLGFFSTALDSIALDPLAKLVDFIRFFASILLALVMIRLVSELAVAIFRINDNLSPDGGKSELADIDPVAEARRAAETAAARAREVTKTAGEKAQAAGKSARETVSDAADSVQSKAKSSAKSTSGKTSAAPTKSTAKKAPVKKAAPKKAPVKKTASKTTSKSTASKTTASKTTTAKKRGPRKGTKVPRDAQGRLLKKDGTPRAKPGPKKT